MVYLNLCELSLRMWTDVMLTGLAFKRCMEVSRGRKATKDGFVLYRFQTWNYLGLEKDSVLVYRRDRGSSGTSTALILAVVLVFFQADRQPLHMNDAHRDYDEYRGINVNQETASGIALDVF